MKLSALLGLALALSGCASSERPRYVKEEVRVRNDMEGVELTVGFNRPVYDQLDEHSLDLRPGQEATRTVMRREGKPYTVFAFGYDRANRRTGQGEFVIYARNPEPKPGDAVRLSNAVFRSLRWQLLPSPKE